MKPAFIRKKYNSFQDEVDQQKQVGPVYENKKRINAINEAIQNKVDIVVLDDGFQDLLKTIAAKNPDTPFGQSISGVGRSIKQVKTSQAVEKWKKKSGIKQQVIDKFKK